MIKSGIVTFHTANNYGAVLQAFALKFVGNKLCGKCDIVDYRCKHVDARYKYIINWSSPKSIIKSILRNLILKKNIRNSRHLEHNI